MVNIKKQTVFSLLIAIGAIILLYDIATENEMVELKIGGLVLLMIGLYGATRQWVDDNKKEDTSATENQNEASLVDETKDKEEGNKKD